MSSISFGYQRQPEILLNDTNKITALLFVEHESRDSSDIEDLVPVDQISSATLIIQRPQDPPGNFINLDCDIADDGTAVATVASSEHDEPGQYIGVCQFIYGPSDTHDDFTTSVPITYNVNDPFESSGAQKSDPSVDACWARISDLFDSEDGGPYLRDITMGRFDKSRVRLFVPDVLFDINAYMPVTDFKEPNFPYNQHDGGAVFTQGLLVRSIAHLIRSYAEQPDVMNSPVAYMDRKRYLDAWSSVYNMELERYEKMVEMFKRRFFAGGNKMLIGSKAGRGFYGPWRTRGIWPRGY